jgi:sugar/nucleoside kinase (ribokinase family)
MTRCMTVNLLGISNAVVDVLANVDHDFLQKINAPPGSMMLIDENRAGEIYGMMGPAMEMSGGSVANTVAGFANLGGTAAYIGKVKADQLGEIFEHDMRSLGVDVRLPAATDGAPTARSHILITPDGQRTMQTYLGACTELRVSDVTAATVNKPDVTLLEGYVWDIAEGPALLQEAVRLVHANGGTVALSLSDSFCVQRHRQEFADFVRESVDIVFADEDEIMALLEVTSFDDVPGLVAAMPKLFVLTRSEKGSVIVQGKTVVVQPASKVEKVLDSTGAGDAYTAGFLFGRTHGKALADCARLGTWCATNIIQRVGARLEKDALNGFA